MGTWFLAHNSVIFCLIRIKFVYKFKRRLAVSIAPKIWVLGMFKLFGIIGPKLDQIWAWPHSRQQEAVGVHDPFKSFLMGPSLLGNCYLENNFHK